MGHGGTEFTSDVVRVAGGHRWSQIAVAFSRSCGVTLDGAAYCWGLNPTGAATPGLKALESSSRAEPVPVTPRGGIRFRAVATGMSQSCGLTVDRRIYCWGPRAAGVVSAPGAAGFTAVAVGDTYACALDAAGAPLCWHSGAVPARVPAAPRLETIAVAGRTACGVDAAGTIHCWSPPREPPARVAAAARFTAVAPGDSRSCALDAGGRIWCWGRPPAGRVPPESAQALAPRPLPLAGTFATIAVTAGRVCGVERGGRLACWRQDYGLPLEKREGQRTVERWFLWWGVGGAMLGLLLGAVSSLRSGAWGAAAGMAWGVLMGTLAGLAGAVVVGFFKVIESLG